MQIGKNYTTFKSNKLPARILFSLFCTSICFSFLMLLSSVTVSEKSTDLTIIITNLRKTCGIIRIGIYDKKEHFPKVGKEFKKLAIKVEGKDFKYTVKNLPVGNYAVALYHDENSDGECNTNLIGIPTESYGFSNNIKPFLSAPSFQDTKFSLFKANSLYIKLFH